MFSLNLCRRPLEWNEADFSIKYFHRGIRTSNASILTSKLSASAGMSQGIV